MKRYSTFILTIVLSLVFANLRSYAQEDYWIKMDSLYKSVQPSASLQMWSIYSMDEQAQLVDNGPLEKVEDRASFLARRARLGFKGKPYKRLTYNVSIQYDNLGKDKLSSLRGGTNTGTLGILDAYITVRLTRNELVSVTTGFFHPQISRECITGDLLVNSFDKSSTQTYIRQHMVGKNYGRSTGINVGGDHQGSRFTVGYNLGFFNNNTTASDIPETSGKEWSPMLAGRATFSFGDPEKKTYSINYDVNNFFNKRKGITIGLNRTQQGKTETFTNNTTTGVDVLFNYAMLNLDGEWFWLDRQVEGKQYTAQTGHARIGYNIIVSKKLFIEPTLMWTSFTGDNASFSGVDRSYDAGVNWYLNKKNCKLSLHYVVQEGRGDNGYTDETTFKKGNFVGCGLVLII